MLRGDNLFPDNWIYIHDPSVRMGRIQNFKNWSPEMVPDPSMTCLGLEYFCFEGDDLWTMPDEELVELGKREIGKLKLADPSHVVDGAVVRAVKAYPVYDGAYTEAVSTVRTWLERLGNLQLVGRNGMHRYNNQDHSMLTAMLAARNILGGEFDLWQVNVEQEYHEEGREVTLSDLQKVDATQPMVPRKLN
jgi:protoporphyrinogen oxidase